MNALSDSMKNQMAMASNVHDIASLDSLRQVAHQDNNAALNEAAKHFESLFVHMLLKSMRQANDLMADEDSPFNSDQVKFYRDMHDQQMATELASSGSLGLADLIVQQLGGDPNVTPAGILRDNPLNKPVQEQSTNASERQQIASARVDLGRRDQAFESEMDFVNSLLPIAQQVTQGTPFQPLAVVAQAALETGWGQQMIHSVSGENSHNLFGMKANSEWHGNRTLIDSVEYLQGTAQRVRSAFKAYPDFTAAMQDYLQLIGNSPRYSEAVAQAQSPEHYFRQLQQAGYATDPDYADKIHSVFSRLQSLLQDTE